VYNTAVLYSEIAVKVLKLLYNVSMKEEYLFAELALELAISVNKVSGIRAAVCYE